MKYKINKKDLKECITEAVIRVLKEDEWDDILTQALESDPKRKKAEKLAKRDSEKEEKDSEKEDEKLSDIESSEMDASTDDEEESVGYNSDYARMSYEELIDIVNNPESRSNQKRMAKSELRMRKIMKRDYEEDVKEYGEKAKLPWGYIIDDNGNVQPTHSNFGGNSKNSDVWTTGSFDNGGLNFGWGHDVHEYDR